MPADRKGEHRRTRTIAAAIMSVATLSMMAWAVLAAPAWADGSDGSTTSTMTTTTEPGSNTTTTTEAGTNTTTTTKAGSETSTPTEATTTASGSTSGSIYTARDAGSTCDENGHVIIHASIRNNSDTLSLTVTVTDITFAGQSDTAVVGPGQTHTFFLDAGPGPLPGGQVAFHVVWDGGSADFVRGHSPTDCPSTSTTVTETTTTTAAGTSTTTTAGTTTTGTTTTTTSPPVSGTTVTPPMSSNTPSGNGVGGQTVSSVRPAGTAFTGLQDVVPLGTIALVLMTGGSGLLWASARRRHDDGEDED